MKNKHRLIIDASSIIRAMHYAGRDSDYGFNVKHEGKNVWVNSAWWGFENFITSYRNMLRETGTTPVQTILVKDGINSSQLRKQMYPEYKGKRKPPPDELNEQYYELLDGIEDEILSMGGTVMVQNGMEADDVIAYLAKDLEGKKTIWSRDGDMLALRSDDVDIMLNDQLNPELYDQCPFEYVLLWKALVGDSSDNLPGAKGFGKKRFVDMILKFGYEGCDAMLELLETRQLHLLAEDVEEFKPLQKILDDQQGAYISYQCAKFYPQRVNTTREPLSIKTGKVEEWDPEVYHPKLKEYFGTKKLVTARNYKEVLDFVKEHMPLSPFTSLDLEGSSSEESDKWVKAIRDSKKDKRSTILDILGQELAGCSITFGSNVQHTIYCSVDHAETENCSLDQLKAFIDLLPPDVNVAVHNANYELTVLHKHYSGFWLQNVRDTVDLASHVDENQKLGLKPLAQYYLGYTQQTYDDVTCTEGPVGTIDDMGTLEKTWKNVLKPKVMEEYVDAKGKTRRRTVEKEESEMWETRRRKMNELSAEHVFDYGCDDTIVCAALYNRFLLTMELEKTIDAYRETDIEATYWVTENYINGIDVDLDLLKKFELEDDAKYDELEKELHDYLFANDWKGCYYEPFEDLSPASIKIAYTQLTGEVLKTMVRLPEKLAAALQEAGQPELAEYVLSEDLEGFNDYMEGFFVGVPDFDPEKDADLRSLMYDHLGLPIRFRNRVTEIMRAKGVRWGEGTPKADFDSVEHALLLDTKEGTPEHRVLEVVREMKAINTRRKLYYRPWPLLVHWTDGKFHVDLGKNLTVTRRFAPSKPNINQIAKKGEGKKIRMTIIAIAGYLIVAMDFSGQELRLAAEESQDEMLLSCFIGDNLKDPHSLTGAGIAEKDEKDYGNYELFEEIRATDDHAEHKEVGTYRDKGKRTNFSTQYLCQAPKLAKTLVVEIDEAQKFIDAKDEVYHGLAAWQQDTIAEAHAQGYVTTRLGARRHVRQKLIDPERYIVLEAERQSVNFKIQGSGSEMTKRSINAMQETIKRYGVKFLMPVHDEAVFMIPTEHIVPAIQELHACMVQPYGDMTVPLESEISIGTSFGSLLKVGVEPVEADIMKVVNKLAA